MYGAFHGKIPFPSLILAQKSSKVKCEAEDSKNLIKSQKITIIFSGDVL